MYNILLTTTQELDALLSAAILVSFSCNLLDTCTCLVQINNQETTYVLIYKIIFLFLIKYLFLNPLIDLAQITIVFGLF